MRRLFTRVTLASIAVAAAMLLASPTQQPEHPALPLQAGQVEFRYVLQGEAPYFLPDGAQVQILVEPDVPAPGVTLRGFLEAQPVPEIDPEISIMDCRIVTQERLDGDQFLLTEECKWKGGGVERRRFLALQKGDGPAQGWMYRLAESDS
jgi:hypothetical protein